MEKQTAGRENLGKLAPKFAELNDDVLFGEVWSREDKMSLRDRSMITISALMAQGLFPQLKSHFILGKKHGVTKNEAVEIVTHGGVTRAINGYFEPTNKDKVLEKMGLSNCEIKMYEM